MDPTFETQPLPIPPPVVPQKRKSASPSREPTPSNNVADISPLLESEAPSAMTSSSFPPADYPTFLPSSHPDYFTTADVPAARNYRYIPAVKSPTFNPDNPGELPYYRTSESNPRSVRASWEDRSPFIRTTRDGLGLAGDKGFRSARLNVPIREGAWFFEVEIVRGNGPEDPPPGVSHTDAPHVRLGWARREASLNAPVGYDGYSYGIRDRSGEKVTLSRPRPYGKGFKTGDVIGLYISLPPLRKADPRDRLDPAQIVPKRMPIQYKSHTYFESSEYTHSKEMGILFDQGTLLSPKSANPSASSDGHSSLSSSAKTKNTPSTAPGGRSKRPGPGPSPDILTKPTIEPLRPLPKLHQSCISFFVNGEPQGIAFEDIYSFLQLRQAPVKGKGGRMTVGKERENAFDDGTLGYYPMISLYGYAEVRIQPGPDFKFPPPSDFNPLPTPEPSIAEEVLKPAWRPLSERYAPYLAELVSIDEEEERMLRAHKEGIVTEDEQTREQAEAIAADKRAKAEKRKEQKRKKAEKEEKERREAREAKAREKAAREARRVENAIAAAAAVGKRIKKEIVLVEKNGVAKVVSREVLVDLEETKVEPVVMEGRRIEVGVKMELNMGDGSNVGVVVDNGSVNIDGSIKMEYGQDDAARELESMALDGGSMPAGPLHSVSVSDFLAIDPPTQPTYDPTMPPPPVPSSLLEAAPVPIFALEELVPMPPPLSSHDAQIPGMGLGMYTLLDSPASSSTYIKRYDISTSLRTPTAPPSALRRSSLAHLLSRRAAAVYAPPPSQPAQIPVPTLPIVDADSLLMPPPPPPPAPPTLPAPPSTFPAQLPPPPSLRSSTYSQSLSSILNPLPDTSSPPSTSTSTSTLPFASDPLLPSVSATSTSTSFAQFLNPPSSLSPYSSGISPFGVGLGDHSYDFMNMPISPVGVGGSGLSSYLSPDPHSMSMMMNPSYGGMMGMGMGMGGMMGYAPPSMSMHVEDGPGPSSVGVHGNEGGGGSGGAGGFSGAGGVRLVDENDGNPGM